MYIKEIYYHQSDFTRFTFILTNEKVIFIDFFLDDKNNLDFINILLYSNRFEFEKDELFLEYNEKMPLYEFIFSKYYESLKSNIRKLIVERKANDIYKKILKELKEYEESDLLC